MAARELYEILLKIASESDPSAFNDLKRLADLWKQNGIALEAINKDLAEIAERKYPDVFGKYEEQLRGVREEAQETGGVLSWLIQKLQEMATIAGGIILAQAIMAPIRKLWELGGAAKEMAKDFVEGVKDVNATMQLYKAQFTGLLGGIDQAVNAIAYAREVAFQMPLVDFDEILNAIKLLTAFGLNYQKWLLVIGSVSAATGKDIGTIVNAIGMIASGSVAYGLYYLRRAGIDLEGLSAEGKSASQVLEQLFEVLSRRYGQVLPEMVRTWEGSMSTLGKLWDLFRIELGKPAFDIASEKLADFVATLVSKKDDILAFASVLGEYPANALQRFLDFLGQTTSQIDFQAADFFRGAVNLMVSFADGLLTALDSYVLPAVFGIADLIASFLLGGSPPERGPLSRVYEGAMAVMKTYLLALKEGVDFQTLQEIAGFIQAALAHAVSIGDLPEEQLYDFVIRAREMIARAIGEIGKLGGVTAPTLGELSAFLGPLFADVQTYLGLLAQLKGATDAVAAAQQRLAEAQEWVAEAAEMVRKAQDRMRRFELETAEIPERFTRGRRRELELAIQEAEEEQRRRQETVKIAQEQLRATQEQVKAIQEQVSLQRAYLSEMERIWKLQEEQAKAQEGMGDFAGDVDKVKDRMEELKKTWRPIIEGILKDVERLEEHWTKLGDFIRGILGIKPEPPLGVGWEPGMLEPVSEAYKEGERFRTALETIRDNIYKIGDKLVEIKDTFVSIKDSAIEVTTALAPWVVTAEGINKNWAETLGMLNRIKGTIEAIQKFLDEHPLIKQILGMVGRVAGAISPVGPPSTLAQTIPPLFVLPGARMVGTWLDIAMEAFGFDKAGLLQTWNDLWITVVRNPIDELIRGAKYIFSDAAVEGIEEPLVDVAEDTKKKLVERSIFPDMIDEIVRLFRELPGKLYPYLASLYTTITVWIRLAATSWRLELLSMTTAANNLALALEALIDVLLRVRELLGGSTTGGTNLPRLHAGGPVLRTGQYQLEAGEYVVNRERLALAGVGSLGNTYHLGPFIHNWPEGVDRMKRRQLEKIVKKGAFEAVDELMRRSGRD